MRRLFLAAAVAALTAIAFAATASAGDWSLSLTATPSTVAAGGQVTFTGTLLNPSATQGVPNKPVVIRAYGHDSTCSGAYEEIGPTLTLNKSGEYTKGYYSITDTVPGNASGEYYVRAFAIFDDLTVASDCVKVTVTPVDNFGLTLAITPALVFGSAPVTFTGTLSNSGPSSVAGQTVRVSAYWDDSTCAEPESYGWNTVTDTSGNYSLGPIPTGAPPGNYYYSAKYDGAASTCQHFTIGPTMTFTAVTPEAAYDQWVNVWTHTYTIYVDPSDGTFTGTGSLTGTLNTNVYPETITGALGATTISFTAAYTGTSYSYSFDGGFGTETLATDSIGSTHLDMIVTQPVVKYP